MWRTYSHVMNTKFEGLLNDPAESIPGEGFPDVSIDLSPELNCAGFCTVLSALLPCLSISYNGGCLLQFHGREKNPSRVM